MNKKHFKYYLLIIFLSLLPFISMIFSPLLPHTQDGLVHLARMAAHFKALSDGQFPPRWAADLNYGYGMPLFIFMYPLPYFLTSFFIFLGVNLALAFKLVIILSFMLSGIFMFSFSRELFSQEKIAFWVTLFYQFAPFRLVEANIRGDIGEIYTYAFLPLVLFGILRIVKRVSAFYFLITSLASALLILSHNSISLVFFLLSMAFAMLTAKTLRQVILAFEALFFGMAISAFYWLPALYEHKFTLGNLFMIKVYQEYFTPLYKFIIPNFLNSRVLNMGDVPVQIGIFHLLGLLLSLVVFFRQRVLKEVLIKRVYIFSWLILLVAIFFTQPVSSFFWEKINFLRQFQFPWRFLAVIVFASSLLSVSFFQAIILFKNNIYYMVVLLLLILSTIIYWQTPFGYESPKESDYWNYPLTTTYYGETDLIWSAGPAGSYPKNRIELIGGQGTIRNINQSSTKHQFSVLAQTPVTLVDRTQFFPGWRVLANNKEIPIQFQDPNHRGLITFNLSPGNYQVMVKFSRTKDRLIADWLSLISIFIFILLCLHQLYRKLLLQNLRP